jgi:hypothetical protein
MQISCLENYYFGFGSQDINKTINNKDITGKIKTTLAAEMLMATINSMTFAEDNATRQPGIQISGSSKFVMRGTTPKVYENIDSSTHNII